MSDRTLVTASLQGVKCCGCLLHVHRRMYYVLCFYQVVANPDGMSFAKDNTKPIGGEKRK